MSRFDPTTTWIGLLGKGFGGGLIIGGSSWAVHLYNMADPRRHVRVEVRGMQLGVMGYAGAALGALIVTGCSTKADMDRLKSSGVDWALSLGASGKSALKIGAGILGKVVDLAKAAGKEGGFWAADQATKALVRWCMNDLGILQAPGRQFYLIPWPLALEVGMGGWYEYQTLYVADDKFLFKNFPPAWAVENSGKGIAFQGTGVLFQMYDVPMENGELIKLVFRDANTGDTIRWKNKNGSWYGGDVQLGRAMVVNAVVFDGMLFEEGSRTSYPGLNLNNLIPAGRVAVSFLQVKSKEQKWSNQTLRLRPEVWGIPALWTAKDTFTVRTNKDGVIEQALGNRDLRH